MHREHVRGGLVDRDVDPLGGQQGEVVEGADARGRRRDGEREVPDALEQEVRADRKVEREGVLADHVVHGHVGEPHRRRRAEDGHEPRPAAERPEPVHEVRRRAREAGVPARREPPRRAPGEALCAIGVAGGEGDEHDPEGRPGGERDAGQEHRPSLADGERAEEDPRGEDDAVEQPLGEERPGGDEDRDLTLAQRLDAEEVTAARGENVVRAAAHRDGREQLPEAEPVPRALEEVAPADGHDGHVRDNQGDCRDHRPRGQRHDLAPGLAEVDLAQEEPEERPGGG